MNVREFNLRAILACIILGLAALACSLANEVTTPEPTEAPTKFARAQLLDTPVSTRLPTQDAQPQPAATTPRPAVTVSSNTPRPGTPSATPRVSLNPTLNPVASPTRTSSAPTATKSAGGCPSVTTPVLKPSGRVKSAALGTMNNSVLTPTTSFQTTSKIHVVVTVQNAPANTRVKAGWYANDVGKAAACNTFIDSAELTSLEGSFTVDFSLDPTNPVGTYRVEILLNGNLDQVLAFNIK